MRRVGGRVRVTAQLIHAASDAHLWAKDFDHDFADVLKLQAEVADAIVREIKIQITPDEARRLTASRPVNPKAYDLVMLGRYHYWQSNANSWKQSISELEEAVRLQPDYAPAHASLAMAWNQGRDLGFTQVGRAPPGGSAEGDRARSVTCGRVCGAGRASNSTIGIGTARSPHMRRRSN